MKDEAAIVLLTGLSNVTLVIYYDVIDVISFGHTLVFHSRSV